MEILDIFLFGKEKEPKLAFGINLTQKKRKTKIV